jgi:hypothetical protein
MYSQIGEAHPGYDCFVFRRDAYPKFNLGTAIIGSNYIGKILISNVTAHSNMIKIFENLHLTFHIGDDRSWKKNDFSDYDELNKNQLINILVKLNNDNMINGNDLVTSFYTKFCQTESQPSPSSISEHIKNIIKKLLN